MDSLSEDVTEEFGCSVIIKNANHRFAIVIFKIFLWNTVMVELFKRGRRKSMFCRSQQFNILEELQILMIYDRKNWNATIGMYADPRCIALS